MGVGSRERAGKGRVIDKDRRKEWAEREMGGGGGEEKHSQRQIERQTHREVRERKRERDGERERGGERKREIVSE